MLFRSWEFLARWDPGDIRGICKEYVGGIIKGLRLVVSHEGKGQ